MSPPRVPLTLIPGCAGPAAVEALARRIRARPPGERWAVIVDGALAGASLAGTLADGAGVNLAETLVDGAGAPDGGVRVVAAGGCACCSGATVLRVTLTRLLREGGWQRIVVAAGAAARPEALVALLGAPAFAPYLALEPPVNPAAPAPVESLNTGRPSPS